jgi:hypothetical protein
MEQLLSQADRPGASMSGDAHVATDLDCVACGYNLRSLAWAAKCPECGGPVEASRVPAGFPFRSYAEARWARRGALVLAAGIALLAFAAVLSSVIFVTLRIDSSVAWSAWPPQGFRICQFARSAGFALQAVATIFLLKILRVHSPRRQIELLLLALIGLGGLAALPWRSLLVLAIGFPSNWPLFALNGCRELFACAAILALAWVLHRLRMGTAAMRENRWGELLKVAVFLLMPELLGTLFSATNYFIQAFIGDFFNPSRWPFSDAARKFLNYSLEWAGWWRIVGVAPAWMALFVLVWIACRRLNQALRPAPLVMEGRDLF